MLGNLAVSVLEDTIQLRLSREDRERWERAAAAAGLRLSQWIRAQCAAAAGGECIAVAIELRTIYREKAG